MLLNINDSDLAIHEDKNIDEHTLEAMINANDTNDGPLQSSFVVGDHIRLPVKKNKKSKIYKKNP